MVGKMHFSMSRDKYFVEYTKRISKKETVVTLATWGNKKARE
jgi:amino acid transporter